MERISESTLQWAGQRSLPVIFQEQTGSTNNDAKAAALSEDHDLVLYLADHQTSGRGRGTNHWLDTGAGESLLSTWSFQVQTPPQAITAPRIGLSLFQAASRTWPSLSWGLKAPNDLYLDGLKVGGLLVESVSSGGAHRLLIGLGMNIVNHPRSFNTATHLTGALGRALEEAEWFQFLDELKQHLGVARNECLKPALTAAACTELKNALNANRARAYVVTRVSPAGDIEHAGGTVHWTEI